MNKIFGIGLSRTGTTSLTKALQLLGFSTIHYPKTFGDIEQCRAATDTPVANGYKFLDFMYPGSKFICTHREMNSWLRSCATYWRKNLQDQPEQMQKLHMSLYGSVHFRIDAFGEAYLRHDVGVMDYFRDRQAHWPHFKGDFIYLNVCKGCGWEVLCPFLEVPIPNFPFPHENQNDYSPAK